VVLFRLICPVSFSLPVSLYSVFDTDIRTEAVIEYIPTDIVHTPYPKVNLPLPDAVNDAVNEELPYGLQQTVGDPLEAPAAVFSFLWLNGAALLLLWNLAAYIILLIRLRKSVKTGKGIYESDLLDTAIVTGLVFPRIHLPAGLDEETRQCVLAHEKQHIRRGDPWFKFLFFVALCIHWYNPLVWIAFRMAVRDMEMACDEGVLRKLGEESRQLYASALLNVAAGRKINPVYPIAFGESDIRTRIRNVLSFGKTAKWIAVTAAVLVLAVTVVLAANPVKKPDVYEASYKVAGTLNYQDMTDYEPYRVTVTENELIVSDDGKTQLFSGQLVERRLSFPAEIEEQFAQKNKHIRERYQASSARGECYLAVTVTGEIWLAVDWNVVYLHDVTRMEGIYLLESNTAEPDELYFLAMIESYGGPRAQLMSTWQSEKFLSGETWYIVSYRAHGREIYPPDNSIWTIGYATFRMKDGQYEMTANRRYPVEEILPGVMLCDDPASLSADYNLSKESYDVLFILDDSVTQLDQKLNGKDYTRVWFSSAPAMVVVPYEKEGITYTATYADGTERTYGEGYFGLQLTDLEMERERMFMDLASLHHELDELTNSLDAHHRAADDLQAKIDECTAILDEYNHAEGTQRTKLQRAAETMKEKLTGLQAQYETLQAQDRITEESMVRLEQQIAAKNAEIEKIQSQIDGISQ
ncbi:MAG: hypothetical protein IJ334_01570, partial [Clostridia bacterium]|nr:hypothetical protein [Clostridia bacterium]